MAVAIACAHESARGCTCARMRVCLRACICANMFADFRVHPCLPCHGCLRLGMLHVGADASATQECALPTHSCLYHVSVTVGNKYLLFKELYSKPGVCATPKPPSPSPSPPPPPPPSCHGHRRSHRHICTGLGLATSISAPGLGFNSLLFSFNRISLMCASHSSVLRKMPSIVVTRYVVTAECPDRRMLASVKLTMVNEHHQAPPLPRHSHTRNSYTHTPSTQQPLLWNLDRKCAHQDRIPNPLWFASCTGCNEHTKEESRQCCEWWLRNETRSPCSRAPKAVTASGV